MNNNTEEQSDTLLGKFETQYAFFFHFWKHILVFYVGEHL